MEYDIDLMDGLDIYQENALTLILKQIETGKRVLEFGPAYGRMTRFLKEKMHCSVSCVEVNGNAKKILEGIADKVVIGDIEEYSWMCEFDEEAFDYIIFADVLEHLVHPGEVLKRAASFLKIDGKIFISVPNISHSAVVESLYLNHFDYQEWGILDKTHLRFFAKSTLEKMVCDSGLSVCSRFATYYNSDMAGILNGNGRVSVELQMMLEERPYAKVYQFVYGLCKNDSGQAGCIDQIKTFLEDACLKIYIDGGEGYSEDRTYEKKYAIKNECCTLGFQFEKPVFIKNLRIDPLDGNCIVELNEIAIWDEEGGCQKVDNGKLDGNALCHFQNTYVFGNEDPQFEIPALNKNVSAVRITMNVLYRNVANMKFFEILCRATQEINRLRDELRAGQDIIFKKNLELVRFQNERLKQEINRIEGM